MNYRKRGDKWYFEISFTDPETGTRKRISRVGGTTKADAARAARITLAKHTDTIGRWQEPAAMSYSDFFSIFMDEYVEVKLRPATVNTYRGVAKNHILPVVGDVRLADLTPRLFQNTVNALIGKLSHGSIQSVVFIIKSSMRYAVDVCMFLPSNPARALTAPPADAPKKKSHVFTCDEMTAIFRKFPENHRFHMAIMLSYHTGMRLGECLALRWADVHLKEREIFIHTTLYDHRGESLVQSFPKTNSSIRTVPIDKKLTSALRHQKKWQMEQRLAFPDEWRGSDFVCTREDGRNLTSDDMRYFGQWCNAVLGNGTFHSLRHTHATMSLEAGEDIELVSKRLGHSSINTTAKVYSHVLDKRKEKSRQLLDEIL
ncbi:site-specific integrase [Selenomonas sp. TAMA-11512]|uniref:site-specific integrase n=1 Tax=Selenomonas sp. TAMA-11512 TaxID=3095337 RepID=UPI0030861563|nr:site-specific integrase [Selenomonas sp. TAMA-11512]